MALSAQNKKFLEFLKKVGVDDYVDKTFDGMFENVPSDMNYFFNWLMDNVTSDNVLTTEEQALYFELEKNDQLPTEEEMNYYLSSSGFTFEELKALDLNYVNFLAQDLEDLNKYYGELSKISSHLESKNSEVDKKIHQNRSMVNTWEKKFDISKQNCSETNLLLGEKLDNIKAVLVSEPSLKVDIASCISVLSKEEQVFNKGSDYYVLNSEVYTSTDFVVPFNLKGDLACVETFLIVSKGSLIEKKTRIKLLSELISQSSEGKSFYDDIYFNAKENKKAEFELVEEIRSLENKVKEKVTKVAECKIKNIVHECLKIKFDFNKSLIPNFLVYKNLKETSQIYNSFILHILNKLIASLEHTQQLKSEICSKLFQMESQVNMDISNMELKKQRFRAVHRNQHPLLKVMQSTFNGDKNILDNSLAIKNIFKLISQATDDSNFVTHQFRINMKLPVKSLLDNVLCGPTNQLLFLPVDLMIKFQGCKKHEGELSYALKRLASTFLESKEKVSKSDREKLLLWMAFLSDRVSTKGNTSRC